ncbi:hypothetical protein AMECASPLE_038497 [Ameca splendens]|uniref:Uncharacterized protein n=1 Tax=Ameca splendens TaxID=208324 RepID=A0ABV0XXF2_9TELE
MGNLEEFIHLFKVSISKGFFSGPLPTARTGDKRFIGLMLLNKWLQKPCAAKSENLSTTSTFSGNIRAPGFYLNKSGVQLFTSNIFNSGNQSPAASATNRRQENTQQLIVQCPKGQLQPAEIRMNHGKKMTQKETSSLQQVKSPQTPTGQVGPP